VRAKTDRLDRHRTRESVDLALEAEEGAREAPTPTHGLVAGDGVHQPFLHLGLGIGWDVQALVLQPDGKIVAAGLALWSPTVEQHFGLARYNTDGSVDGSFGSFGTVTTDFGVDASANALVLPPNGRFVAAGGTSFALRATCQAAGRASSTLLQRFPTCWWQRLIPRPRLIRSPILLSRSPNARGATRLDAGAFRRLRETFWALGGRAALQGVFTAPHSQRSSGLC
jgi:hypothetical protein